MKVNHLTFSVTDLNKAIEFYQQVFNAKLVLKGELMAYFDLDGLWIALNVQKKIPRSEITHSYTHIAFTVNDSEFDQLVTKLENLGIVEILEGRPHDKREGRSIYFLDPDGHKFEFHTSNLYNRLDYYRNLRYDLEYFD